MGAGRVEQAVRASVAPGEPLNTPTGRGAFSIARYTTEGLVLLLGAKEAWTPLPWTALEQIPDLLRGRSWVRIGSSYSTDAVAGSLDEHLKRFLARATAGWVAVVLERAGVLEIDRSPPAGSSWLRVGNQRDDRRTCPMTVGHRPVASRCASAYLVPRRRPRNAVPHLACLHVPCATPTALHSSSQGSNAANGR